MAAMAAEPPISADEIMARVAVNQDNAQAARTAFVYRQNVAVRLRDAHNHLVREEISEFQMMPGNQRTSKELVKFSGRYRKGGAMVAYSKREDGKEGGFREEIDSDLAHDMRDDLTSDKKSKDGMAPELFPLTAKEQRKYRFSMKGEETYRGVAVYRIAFDPKPKACTLDCDGDDTPWSGEALIGKSDFEPLLVTTRLAKRIPLFVRTALGTNLPGLGFSIEYQKFDDGVWFPVSYGTEFRIKALFLYSRQVTVSMVNSDFRRADVRSAVEFDKVQ